MTTLSRIRSSPWTRTLVAAVAVLLLFEFGVARSKAAMGLTSGLFVGATFAIEDSIIEPGPDPEVLLFGSSRIQAALSPRMMEADLGLDGGTVMNLAQPFGDAVVGRIVYERNREKLSRAGIAVVGVEMWDVFGPASIDPTTEYLLPLGERLEYGGKDEISLLIGATWKTYAIRRILPQLISNIIAGGAETGPVAPDGRLQFFAADADGPATINAAEQFDERFGRLEEPGAFDSSSHRADLAELVATLQADGMQVILVHLPLRSDFLPELERRLPNAMEQFARVLEDVPGVATVDLGTTLAALGLPDTGYYDFGHAVESGVAALTRHVARVIGDV